MTGLSTPWDVQSLGGGRLLITEREGQLSPWRRGTRRTVALPTDLVWAQGETGLMSLAIDPGFADNGRIYTCLGGYAKSGNDVRVLAWKLDTEAATVSDPQVLISGLPATSGRHGGCRLLITRDGALLVGTGDAAVGTNAQDLGSPGGKTLRLNRRTGAPWPGNRWIDSSVPATRYVFTYGHRNVQGLSQRTDGSLWSAEHGPDRDDEVNRLRSGGNYGWNPVPGYNESVPMTDTSLPGRQIKARWSSGSPTVATSGAAWVAGREWGAYAGTLAVAALKGERVLFMKFDAQGKLRNVRTPPALRKYGRLRSITQTPRGDLLITTGNGTGDRVLRVRPRRSP
ncbi:PQQ-dependent sugar dehydrogenase [Nocardioides sp. InS609-2]|uniref:PQQ-dependent sugar dehydrogenase n=1 Tax=Nocardioides sp. InS609-2 TaxID=2760705 RepID=UPI0020BF9C84|nr:PQQ-dependent sugar dehydrogenase [Nocardioides sp. InS609-2]